MNKALELSKFNSYEQMSFDESGKFARLVGQQLVRIESILTQRLNELVSL